MVPSQVGMYLHLPGTRLHALVVVCAHAAVCGSRRPAGVLGGSEGWGKGHKIKETMIPARDNGKPLLPRPRPRPRTHSHAHSHFTPTAPLFADARRGCVLCRWAYHRLVASTATGRATNNGIENV